LQTQKTWGILRRSGARVKPRYATRIEDGRLKMENGGIWKTGDALVDPPSLRHGATRS